MDQATDDDRKVEAQQQALWYAGALRGSHSNVWPIRPMEGDLFSLCYSGIVDRVF